MPDPPDEAFSDGGDLMLSLLLGWLPSTLICLPLFSAAVVWRRITRSRPTSALAADQLRRSAWRTGFASGGVR